MKTKTPKELEALVQEYCMNPIICLAFGIDYYDRQEIDMERDKEIIRCYVKNFYFRQEKKHEQENQ